MRQFLKVFVSLCKKCFYSLNFKIAGQSSEDFYASWREVRRYVGEEIAKLREEMHSIICRMPTLPTPSERSSRRSRQQAGASTSTASNATEVSSWCILFS